MSFWSDIRWRSRPLDPKIVEPFDPDAIEDANYLLSIGDEIYVSSSDQRNKKQKLTDDDPSFFIEPGQFAFLLTAERVVIPFNCIGFISIRASIKFTGLVNISGFHVDPGYSGKLIFAVFNAGPTKIHLQRGQRLFPLWIADLDQAIARRDPKKGYEDIPTSLITQISGDFTTAYQVKTQLDQIREEIANLNAFKLKAAVVIGSIMVVLGAILFPILKERIADIFSFNPPAKSQIVAPISTNSPPQLPPSKNSGR
jgi:dCTP deaminase